MPKQRSVAAPMRCAAAPASIVVVTLGSPDAGALGDRRSAVADFGACAWAWAGMAAAHRLTRPSDMVGACLTFDDGTTSRVFRETRAVGVAVREPVLLVIAFR